MNATALIAEDEPLLAQALQAELAHAWPDLRVLATVGDGASAVAQALSLHPDVLFLDIRMPVQSGLDAAADLADAWPADRRFPALVFVTAYDEYAVQVKKLMDKHVLGIGVQESKGAYVVGDLGAHKPEAWSEEKTRNEKDIIQVAIRRRPASRR